MKITFRKFQEGGAMPTQEAAPQQDPLMMITEMAAQALQAQDCQAAFGVCQAFLELVQGAQQQQPATPAEEAPASEPVYRRGGTLVRRIKK